MKNIPKTRKLKSEKSVMTDDYAYLVTTCAIVINKLLDKDMMQEK